MHPATTLKTNARQNAAPVAARQAVAMLRTLADEVIVVAVPEPFGGVGMHYRDFRQTPDAEVVRLIVDSRATSD